jgi:hypothetical protein
MNKIILLLSYIVITNAFNTNYYKIKINKPFINKILPINKKNISTIIIDINKSIYEYNSEYNSDNLYTNDGITSYSKY